ncbi:MAG: DUF2267 domain-containing protein [Alphaproteobacteria bacterium]|nr:DUF2267 domain-containing protein [Alphaproteobacteria bacterium]
MEQLISQLASQFGIDEALAHKAVGMVLSLLQNQGDSGAVSELFEKLPGAGDLAAEYAGGGGGGGLGGMLGGLMGGGAGEAMKLVGSLQSDGLSMDQIKGIGTGLLDHAKQEGGEDLVRRAVEGIPGVSDYI